MDKRRILAPGMLLVLMLSLLAAGPFLARPGLPRDTDAELHVFRAAELASCWRAGVVYPRWAPDFYFGYGYPIFNYYAPLSYHLAALFDLLPGVEIVTAVKAVFVLSLLLGGSGVYLLLRDLGDGPGGVVGAAAFLLAPYVVFIDPHARGDLAEQLAVGLLPLALWSLRRLVARGGRWSLAGTALLTAALLTAHNLLGGIGLGLLLLNLGWQVAVEGRRAGLGRGALALALGLALSGFFWLPMVAELDAVRLSVVGGGHFDFRNHFVALGELLAPARIIDLGAAAPHYRFNLGLGQWLLAAVGVAVAVVRRRRDLGFFALLGAGAAFLITPASRFVWEMLPPLAYLQFPWRLLGPAALALAVLTGGGAALVPLRWRRWLLPAALLLLLALALPTMFPPAWEADFGDTSPAGIVAFELEGKVVGTTSTGDFVPRTVDIVPQPQPSLVASYDGAGPVDKVNRATLPPGTTVAVLSHGPLHDRFYVSGEHNFVFRLYTFYFPGWHAYVDGEEVEIEIGRPEGLITFWLPPGEHDVLVRFEDTAARRAGWLLAAAGLVALLLAVVRAAPRSPAPDARPEWAVWAGLSGALLLFAALFWGLVRPHDGWFRYTSPPGEAWAAQYQQRAVLGGEVEFLGFDLPRRTVRSGDELTVVLYWRALHPLADNYQSFAHLTYPAAISWGQSDALNPGGLPTSRWSPQQYLWDEHRVLVRPGTPPGEYTLEVGLYTMQSGRRLPVTGPDGEPLGETVVLSVPVRVVRPLRQPAVDELGMDEEVGAVYDDQVRLLGFAAPARTTDAPGFIHLTLFWQAARRHPDDLVITVAVVDGSGAPVAMGSGAPAVGRYPTSLWGRGEIVRDPYAFWLGDDFAPGEYTVGVVVHRGDQPITPAGMDEPFVELYTVQVQRLGE